MALITKPPAWAYCTTNLTGTPISSGALGTTITAGANNADGSSVSILSALSYDAEYIVISTHGFTSSGANASCLLDILIDPSGGTSWTPIINDLLVGVSTAGTGTTPPGINYHFPLWVKSGSSIGARARIAHTSTVTGRIVLTIYGGNANPSSWWCGQSVESIGISAASSQGTNHTAGNSGAYSSWTDFGSPITSNAGAIQYAVQGTNTNTTANNAGYYFEFGAASTRIGPNIYRTTNTAESGWISNQGVNFCTIPAGTQLQVRGTCSGTAQTLDVAAYVVS